MGGKGPPTLITNTLALWGLRRMQEKAEKGKKLSTGVCEVLSERGHSCKRTIGDTAWAPVDFLDTEAGRNPTPWCGTSILAVSCCVICYIPEVQTVFVC